MDDDGVACQGVSINQDDRSLFISGSIVLFGIGMTRHSEYDNL